MLGKTKKLFRVLLSACLFISLAGCWKEELPQSPPILGKRPVYVSGDELADIRNLPPRDIINSGTIFLQDSLLFLLERGLGIHVFSVADPTQTVALTFLKIPAVSDFSIFADRLYADSWEDLVTLDISDVLAVRILDRQPGVLQPSRFPPLYSGHFECVDLSRGAVTGWEDALLDNPRCWTIQ